MLARCQRPDAVEDLAKQPLGYGNFGQLEDYPTSMKNYSGPGLDQLGLDAAQRPMLDCGRQSQPPQEIAQIIGQHKQSQSDLIRRKTMR